jgi:autotransporter-associated beta strand protein
MTTITNLVLADEPASGSPTLTMNSQVNINGGAVLRSTSIDQGNVAGVTTLNTKVNWTNGTIGNITGSDLTINRVSLVLAGSSSFDIDATSTGSSINSVISGGGSLAKSGAGLLTLYAANTYTGNTTVNVGTLALGASGSIDNSTNIVVAGGATLDVSAVSFAVSAGRSIGSSSPGALSIGNVDVSNGALGLTCNDSASALSVLNGSLTLASGTSVTVSNTGSAFGNGSYKLVTAGSGGAVVGGVPASVSVVGGGIGNGGSAVLSLVSNELYLDVSGVASVNTNPPVLVNTISGNTMTLSWPEDHLGWRLEVQTNTLSTGLGTNWLTWPDSTNVTTVPITVDRSNPTMFFRLVYP